MSPTYAEKTSVAADRSRAEIERTLARYGATAFGYGWSGAESVVTFEARGRRIQFRLEMPDRDDRDFTVTPTGRKRSPSQAEQAWEQATRQRWRALALVVKAKLEAVEAGIAEFEEEFLAYILVPGADGRPTTVGEAMRPQIEKAYEGKLDRGLLLALPAAGETT